MSERPRNNLMRGTARGLHLELPSRSADSERINALPSHQDSQGVLVTGKSYRCLRGLTCRRPLLVMHSINNTTPVVLFRNDNFHSAQHTVCKPKWERKERLRKVEFVSLARKHPLYVKIGLMIQVSLLPISPFAYDHTVYTASPSSKPGGLSI